MRVNFFNSQSDFPISEERILKIVPFVIESEGQTCDEVSIYYVTAEEICALHQEFFDDPSLTDCISFPLDTDEDDFPGTQILGDIFVCPYKAIRYTEEEGGSIEEEIILYTIHGLLHLMGYDDIEEEDQMNMRAAEKRHLSRIKQVGL